MHRPLPLPWLPLLLALLATPARGDEPPPTLASALRAPGPVLVVHADEAHAALADKVADELGPLRAGRPERLALADLDRVAWRRAHVVVLADALDHPWLVAATGGLDAAIGPDGLQLAGVELAGDDAAAAVVLPRDEEPDRWTLLMLGTGPGALMRLDRAIRNDLAAPMLTVDDGGERLAGLRREGEGWRAPPGDPYRPDEVVETFEGWRRAARARVERWELAVAVAPEPAALRVEAGVILERRRRGGPSIWLQLNPRVEVSGCEVDGDAAPFRVHDARDGRVLVRVDAPPGADRLTLRYRLPLDGRIDAWYLGPDRGYVMPEANWVPRVRGEADEAYRARAPHSLSLDAAGGGSLVGGDPEGRRVEEQPACPILIWGHYRVAEVEGGDRAWLAPGAPREVDLRATAVLEALPATALPGGGTRTLVATDRPAPWYGRGTLMATPELLEPGEVDELDRWLLTRVVTEESVRISPSTGGARTVAGRAEPAADGATARLWRARGSWWQQLDEGPVEEDGSFTLTDRGRGERLLTVDAPGYVPGVLRLSAGAPSGSASVALEPLAGADLVCFRCGPDQRPERFEMAPLDDGGHGVTLALGELHRAYGSFPYAFEVTSPAGRRVRVLDPRRSRGQFPSFLDPEEFHATVVEFVLPGGPLRYWIEIPDALLLREGWVDDAPLSPGASPP